MPRLNTIMTLSIDVRAYLEYRSRDNEFLCHATIMPSLEHDYHRGYGRRSTGYFPKSL